jgi:hypothetical protein
MPRPKKSERDRKPRKAAASAKTKRGAAASSQAPAPSDTAPAEMTVEALIRKLEEDRDLAITEGRAAAAVNATVAMGRLLRLLPDKFGRPPSPHKPGRGPAPPAKFDGNYNDAARRILFLLGLATKEKAAAKEKAEEPDKANGQKRDRPS